MSARTRRLVAATGVSIVVVAAIIARYSALSNADPAGDLRPPMPVRGPLLAAMFLAVPGLLALVGALRRSSVIVVIAGVCALLQSFVAFSGVTFGFLLPALLLIVLGARDGKAAPAPRRREYAMGLLAIGFLVAAWSVMLGNTETICWIASQAPDGQVMYRRVPDTGSLTLGSSELGGGCDSGIPTIPGLLAGATLALGSLGVAWFARHEPA